MRACRTSGSVRAVMHVPTAIPEYFATVAPSRDWPVRSKCPHHPIRCPRLTLGVHSSGAETRQSINYTVPIIPRGRRGRGPDADSLEAGAAVVDGGAADRRAARGRLD